MYIVVRMKGKEAIPLNFRYNLGLIPHNAESNEPQIFANAEQAKQYAEYYANLAGVKHQVRPAVPDKEWAAREQKRMDTEYVKVPWHDQEWVKKCAEAVNHFVHVSKRDQTLIAFTQTAEKGERDAQTQMGPSKYLMKYYSRILSEQAIRENCAIYRKEYGCDYELKFAFTGDEIAHVYHVGPNSCMAAGASERHGVVAVRAYAGFGLAVAYIERKGQITARVVCWPEKKIFCSLVYGDALLLREVLAEEGYESSYHFQGAKMSLIKGSNGLVALPSIEMARNGTRQEADHILIL